MQGTIINITELEKAQKEILSKKQMTIIKTTITSVNSTLQKVNKNGKVLRGLTKLLNHSTHKCSKLEEEIRNVNLVGTV